MRLFSKKIRRLLALVLAPLAFAVDDLTPVNTGGAMTSIQYNWVSDGSGNATGVTVDDAATTLVNESFVPGLIYSITTTPDGTDVPTDNYDVVVKNQFVNTSGSDVVINNDRANSLALNRDQTNTELVEVWPTLNTIQGKLRIEITNAGAVKRGRVTIVIYRSLAITTTSGGGGIPIGGSTTQLLQWSTNGQAKWVTMSGDATIADGGAVTITQNGQTAGIANALLSRQYHAYVTVSGAVDTTVAAITDASPTKRYCVYVPNGTYTDEAVVCKDYVDIIGQSRDGVILSSSSQTDETIDVAGADTLIANMTVNHTTNIGETRQYPIHNDNLGSVRNSIWVLYNVAVNMLGTYVPISSDTHGAIGVGIFGTQRMYFVDVVADGGHLPGIWVHNDDAESEPAGVYLINCTATSDDLEGFRWGNTGSGQDDSVVIVGGTYSGLTDDILAEDISGGGGEVFVYVDSTTTGDVTITDGTRIYITPIIPLPIGFVNGPTIFAGPVEFGTNGQNINLPTLNGAAGTYRGLYIESGGLGRWRVATDIVAESGSNVGGDLIFTKYNDAGASNGNVLILSRETGLVTVGNSLSVLSNATVSGNAAVTGTLGANGVVTLGDASTDAHVLNGTLTTNQNLAGFNLWANYNSNTGTTGQSIILVGNESANQNAAVRMIAHGTGFTTSGAYRQDGGALAAENALSDGLSIIARHTSGDLRFYAGGGADADLVLTLDDAQLATFAGAVTVNGNTVLGDASTDTITINARALLTSVTDAGPMTATAGNERQIVYNESDSKVYVCTVTGSPATWVALH